MHFKKHVAIIALIAIVVTLSTNVHNLSSQIDWLPTDFAYAYRVSLPSWIKPVYGIGVSQDRVLIAGTMNGSNAVALIDVSDPYQEPKILQLYSLTGSPTWLDTDGYPPTRVVIGSDKGEILLLKLSGGDIIGYVHRVLGADFYVDKAYIARGADGSTKIVVLVSEGGPRTLPCMKCYVYAFDENLPGVFRAGYTTGNASLHIDKIYVQDVEPLKVFTSTSVYYDASQVFVSYLPAQYIVLITNISYIYNNTLYKAPNALVEVLAYSKVLNISYLYGVNADRNGLARIPIPVVGNEILSANLSIRDMAGNVIWFFNFNPKYYKVVDDEVDIPLVILPWPPDTRNALKVYGPPPFMRVKVSLFDLSNVPISYQPKAETKDSLPLNFDSMRFVMGAASPSTIAVFGSSSSGTVMLSTVSIQGNNILISNSVVDYVGSGSKLVDVSTYPSGGAVIASVNTPSSSNIRFYSVGSSFTLQHIYPFETSIRRIFTAIAGQTYSYAVALSNGIQIIASKQYAMPLLRNSTYLVASESGYIDGSVLEDLSTSILVTSNNIVVIKNINTLASSSKPVSLDSIMAPSLRLKILLPVNESISKVYAVFRYPAGNITLKPDKNGQIVVRNIIPGVVYSIRIDYEEPYIESVEIDNIVATSFRNMDKAVQLSYKTFRVTVNIADSISKKVVAPYIILLDDKVVAGPTMASMVTLSAIYGQHTITVRPAEGFEAAYNSTYISLFVNEDANISVSLQRRMYNVRIKVLDSITNSSVIVPLQMIVSNGIEYNLSIPLSKALNTTFAIPYGNATIVVRPASGFEGAYYGKTLRLFIDSDKDVSIAMERKTYTLSMYVKDAISEALIAPIDILVNGSSKISKTSINTLSVSLPYGNWNITIAPSKGFENVYEDYVSVVHVDRDMAINATIQRKKHMVTVYFRDDFDRLIAPLKASVMGAINETFLVDPASRRITTSLPYGNYTIYVEPAEGFESVYANTSTNIFVSSPITTSIRVPRIRYTLSIRIIDEPIGRLLGDFNLYINGSLYVQKFRGGNITLPYGTYTIQLVPQQAFTVIYSSSKPVTVAVYNNTQATITVSRNRYKLTINLREGTTPVKDAVVTIRNMETGLTLTTLLSSEDGSISTQLPFSSYEIIISHPSYQSKAIYINLGSDTTTVEYLSPTIQTLIWRYMPIIGTLIGLGVAVYVAFRVRAIIARRLMREEEIF
ncbi:MAG: hypothetical protein QXT53_00980 [Ignisphaera sp.]